MPIYEYEHVAQKGKNCTAVFEEFQTMQDPPLTACPVCGKPVHRLISRSTGKVNILANSNLKEKGFTKLVRKDKGVYEKEV
ncbi:MAG: FmdB family zinc ribbon protein [Planctomycetota bacterium]